jgi:hypothetical protein
MRLADVRARLGPAWDIVFSLSWLVLGWLCFIGRYRGEYPFLSLDSDTAQVASFAAARMAPPGHFAGDYLLADPRNYAFYSTVQIPIATYVTRVVGDLGLAFIAPIAVLVAMQGIGAYFFARHVFESRTFATFFSVSALSVVRLWPLSDYWGIRGYTTPRDWFQACLPLLLLLVLKHASSEKWRFALMALTGLMTYVHPVSTPPWALGIWLSLWFFLPSAWTHRKRVTHMVLYGSAFVLVALPFVLSFVGSSGLGAPIPPKAILEVIKVRFSAGYTDLGLAFRSLLAGTWQSGALLLVVLGSGLLTFHRQWRVLRWQAICAWTAALVTGTCLLPLIDHTVADALGRLPLEFDLIRGIRYLFLLAWLIGLGGLAQLAKRGGKLAIAAPAVGAGFVAFTLFYFPPSDFLEQGTTLASTGTLLPPMRPPTDRQKALSAAASRSDDAIFMASSTEDALALRFFSRRSVVYSYKDGGSFGYSNHAAMIDWRYRQLWFQSLAGREKLTGNVVPLERLNDFALLARRWGANHLFLAQPVPMFMLPAGSRMIFPGVSYSVIAL